MGSSRLEAPCVSIPAMVLHGRPTFRMMTRLASPVNPTRPRRDTFPFQTHSYETCVRPCLCILQAFIIVNTTSLTLWSYSSKLIPTASGDEPDERRDFIVFQQFRWNLQREADEKISFMCAPQLWSGCASRLRAPSLYNQNGSAPKDLIEAFQVSSTKSSRLVTHIPYTLHSFITPQKSPCSPPPSSALPLWLSLPSLPPSLTTVPLSEIRVAELDRPSN